MQKLWRGTDCQGVAAKGFENTFLLPYPKQPVEIEVTLYSPRKKTMATYKHIVRPDDILIHKRGVSHVTPHRYMLQSVNEKDCIDVAILAEGYTEKEMDIFYQDAQRTCESLFSYEPFRSMKGKFNIVAVASPSTDSGVSVPRENLWKETAIHSHFDTFYSDRYLTTSRVKSIHNALAGIPYEHIIILANTDVYGGGGIYNSYTLTTAHHPMFKPVVVHEFGHSFGGLADEYFYEDDTMTDTYPSAMVSTHFSAAAFSSSLAPSSATSSFVSCSRRPRIAFCASVMPRPNSALSSNREFCHAGP